MKIKFRLPGNWWRDLYAGLEGSVSTKTRFLSTFLVGSLAFLLVVFSANPGYSIQMLTSGLQYWDIAFMTRFYGILANTGYTGVLLTAGFSTLVGMTMTNTVVQLKNSRLSADALGALPGFLAGGCASCGVGVLTVLGFGGVLASMPFQGNLLRLGGIVLLLGLIVRTGDPDTCKIK